MSRSSLPQWLFLAALAALSLPHFFAAPPALAQQAGGDQLFAVTAPGQGQGQNVLFVIDPQSMRLAIYEHRAGGGGLALTAVRNMEHELKFEEWPAPPKREGAGVQTPSVRKIRKDLRPK